MKPKRIQRKRTKGWRMPENTVYVGRGSKWGNPFKVGGYLNTWGKAFVITATNTTFEGIKKAYDGDVFDKPITFRKALRWFKLWIKFGIEIKSLDINELRGKNLACWCKEGEPCHGDILLKMANK